MYPQQILSNQLSTGINSMINGLFILALTAFTAPYIAGFVVHSMLGSYVPTPVVKRRAVVCLACERKTRITGRESLCKICEQSLVG